TVALISFLSVGGSTSGNRLMIKQLPLTMGLPSVNNRAAFPESLAPMKKVRLVFRGEKAIKGQSASLPPAYLMVVVPKPAMLVPHITPFWFVASSIILAMTVQSARVCSSGNLLIKSFTLCLVGFVFASAIMHLLHYLAVTIGSSTKLALPGE